MTLRFRYATPRTIVPVITLSGRGVRPRPIIPVTVIGPAGAWPVDALLDTGADDTVFPERVAATVGIDLSGASTGTSYGVVQGSVVVRYAMVRLRIVGMQEYREWDARVAFTPAKLRQPLLGFAGFLQYFDVAFFGAREEVELTVNNGYHGS